MDRIIWIEQFALFPHEHEELSIGNVDLLNGEDDTVYRHGKLTLTNYRLIWRDEEDRRSIMSLDLEQAIFLQQSSSHHHSMQIYLSPVPHHYRNWRSIVNSSNFNYVTVKFHSGNRSEFERRFNEKTKEKIWTIRPINLLEKKNHRSNIGLIGIERNRLNEFSQNKKTMSDAFEDIKSLMKKAKEMVDLSKVICHSLQNNNNEIQEYRTTILQLGLIDQPVTKKTTSHYHEELAKEMINVIIPTLKEHNGIMSLAEVYCRWNRARGLHMLSPEDVSMAVDIIPQHTVTLTVLEDGTKIVSLPSYIRDLENEVNVELQTNYLTNNIGLSSCTIAQTLSRPAAIIRNILLLLESKGEVCRDEHVNSLNFFPNIFNQIPLTST
ncbi:hypothetical protein SNEBB_007459 [Seison nebaliae]|nr:hypothetical protein SNEBB_007459 [Seison nebaliae]